MSTQHATDIEVKGLRHQCDDPHCHVADFAKTMQTQAQVQAQNHADRITGKRHSSTEHMLRGFSYEHLPSPLRDLSQSFHDLAYDVLLALPDGPELTVALRKLLEAKDAAVRHLVYTRENARAQALGSDRDV